ncbi:MAG: aminotransferase class III-fold pyridoxal phosphate-dependent enzyme, partial [Ekhidna sp.]
MNKQFNNVSAEAKHPSESDVSFYNRIFPEVFAKAKGSFLYDQNGVKYLDFFCGSGSLNYGHNHPKIIERLTTYLHENGIVNSLDQMTSAKWQFIEDFTHNILGPRQMTYKFQFTGPTGTNSIEAAIKLSRKFTGRENVVFFHDSFHGMTYGSMSISGKLRPNIHKDHVQHALGFPFATEDNYLLSLKTFLSNCKTSELPAAIILETIQAEGGMKVATREWLEAVDQLAKDYEILLVIDDIQTGVGRVGTFFSFEDAAIDPDIICMSKSLSGLGIPFAMNLIKPEIDCWNPGEHNGTFRGNNMAFVAAGCMSELWSEPNMQRETIGELATSLEEAFIHHNLGKYCELKGK